MENLEKILQGLPKADMDNLVKLAKSPYFDSILKFNANLIFQTSLTVLDQEQTRSVEDLRYYQGRVAGINELASVLEDIVGQLRERQEDTLGEAIIQPLNVAEKFIPKLRRVFDKGAKLLLNLGKK